MLLTLSTTIAVTAQAAVRKHETTNFRIHGTVDMKLISHSVEEMCTVAEMYQTNITPTCSGTVVLIV